MGHHPLLGQVRSGLQLRNHPALTHDINPVAEADEFRQLATDHEDSDPTVCDPIDQFVDLGLGAHVDAPGGLVQHEQPRRGAQPLAEHTLLLIAAAQGGDQLLAGARDDVELPDQVGSLALLSGR
jgi:hypothetical protein